MELLYPVIGVAAGAVVAWLIMRARHTVVVRDLAERQGEVRQERQRVEQARAEIRQLSEAKARAEQQAGRVEGLEVELKEARAAHQRVELQAATLAKEREAALWDSLR